MTLPAVVEIAGLAWPGVSHTLDPVRLHTAIRVALVSRMVHHDRPYKRFWCRVPPSLAIVGVSPLFEPLRNWLKGARAVLSRSAVVWGDLVGAAVELNDGNGRMRFALLILRVVGLGEMNGQRCCLFRHKSMQARP